MNEEDDDLLESNGDEADDGAADADVTDNPQPALSPDLELALLAFVRRPGYQPLKPRQIAKKLRLDQEQIDPFKRLIKRLIKRGVLVYGARHRVLPVVAPGAAASPGVQEKPRQSDPKRIVGRFRRAAGGFGFVRPEGTLPSVGQDLDIYIAQRDSGDAVTGDIVAVRLAKDGGRRGGRSGNQRSGVILEVVERDTHRFVGCYFERAGVGYVSVDGNLFQQPVSVGDPGAKNAQPDDKVVFEMVRFPSHVHDGEGVIVEVLGPRGKSGVDTLSIIREFELPDEFAPDAIAEARAHADRFDERVHPARVDYTAGTVITIDPIDARDFDDAISLKRLDGGHWLLGVHIADVSHFVRPNTALDREARDRATSVYLPDRVIPMLPETISNALASLQPDRVRYTMSAELEFTAEGVRVGADVRPAAIKSCRRFTYEEVDDYLAHPRAWQAKLTPAVHDLLGRMHEFAMLLRERRKRQGALELSMPEVKIDIDKQGRVCGAHAAVNTASHQIIEEFMLAANFAVAERLRDAGLHFLRRVHQSPDPRKLQALTEFVMALGFTTESLESRFELQQLLDASKDRPERHAVHYAVLRSLQRAIYSPIDEGHYALASDCYCHFTSPIRRYPDLTVHRLLRSLAEGSKPVNDFDSLTVEGQHCSEREQRAEAAERELTKVKLLAYLSTRVGEELEAIVTGVEAFGLFAAGVELPAEGFVHISALTDDYYQFDRTTRSLEGRRAGNRFRLGDAIRVAIARVDVDRRELDFRIVKRVASAPRVPKPGKRPPKQQDRKPAGKKKKSSKRPPKRK